MHYAFDVWISKHFPEARWCRYADDGLIHCKTEQQAKIVLSAIRERMKQCGLELQEKKTRIIYCSDDDRKKVYRGTDIETSFEFLGYGFRRRVSFNKWTKKLNINFTPGVSKSAIKAMCSKTRKMGFRNRTELELEDIARIYNPVLRGWIEYYGRYNRWALYPVLKHFNTTLVAWAMRKYKRLRTSKTAALKLMIEISKRRTELFAHWKLGMVCAFV